MNNDIARFAKTAILFIVILIAFDRLLGYALKKFYFSQKRGDYAAMTYAVDQTRADILVFGSSRALHQYNSSTISKGMGMTCFNTGSNGQKLPYATALQEVIFKRYQPKIVILDLVLWDIQVDRGKYDKLSVLLPYCNEHPELAKYVNGDDRYGRIKLLSQTYHYNSFLLPGAYNALFPSKIPAVGDGYLPLDHTMTADDYHRFVKSEQVDSIEFIKHPDESVDQRAIGMFRSFLANTQKYRIKTYLVLSPFILPPSIRFQKKIALLKTIAKQYPDVTFLDYAVSSGFTYHYQKYADVFHQNATGAEEFSERLVTRLKSGN